MFVSRRCSRGHEIGNQAQQRAIKGIPLQIYHKFAVFDHLMPPPKLGPIAHDPCAHLGSTLQKQRVTDLANVILTKEV